LDFVLQNILLKLYFLRFWRKTSEADTKFTDTDLTLRFAFMPSICNVGYYSLVVFLYCHYMYRRNQPSSGVQVVVQLKDTQIEQMVNPQNQK
jgi:hypothetical protein